MLVLSQIGVWTALWVLGPTSDCGAGPASNSDESRIGLVKSAGDWISGEVVPEQRRTRGAGKLAVRRIVERPSPDAEVNSSAWA